MCSVVEVVGVLSVHPALATSTSQQELDDTSAERRAHSPPPSLVPRLHVITMTHLPHCNPLLPLTLPTPLGELTTPTHAM